MPSAKEKEKGAQSEVFLVPPASRPWTVFRRAHLLT